MGEVRIVHMKTAVILPEKSNKSYSDFFFVNGCDEGFDVIRRTIVLRVVVEVVRLQTS